MKKLLLIFLALIVLAAIGIGVFVITFNADRYRPMLVQKIQEALKRPVGLEKISLGFHGGVALELRGLVIKQDNDSNKDWVRVREASAVVDFGALLRKEIKIGSIIIKEPEIHILPSEGTPRPARTIPPPSPIQRWKYRDTVSSPPLPSDLPLPPSGVAASPLPAAVSSPEGPAQAPVPPMGIPEGFSAESVKIENAKIFLEQRQGEPLLLLQNLDLSAKNIEANQPLEIAGRAGLLSPDQNIKLQSTLTFKSDRLEVGSSELEADLNQIDPSTIRKYAPEIEDSIDLAGTKGIFKFQLEPFAIIPDSVPSVNAKIQLSDGRIVLKGAKTPAEHIEMAGRMLDSQLEIQNLSADFAGGKVNAALKTDLKLASPLSTIRFSAERLSLEHLAPAAKSGAPQPEGLFSVRFEGTAQGKDALLIKQTLTGQGELRVENGVIRNLNVLREIFSKLNMIPGLVKSLSERLPEGYQQKLETRDTPFQVSNLPFQISRGILSFQQLQVAGESFFINGKGSIGLIDNRVLIPLMVYVEPDLSAALTRSVHELQTLADQEGRLQFPVTLQGVLPDVATVIDLQYVAARLLSAKTQEVLSGILSGRKNQETAPSAADTAASADGQTAAPVKKKLPKGSDIFGQLLESALAPKQDSSSTNSSGNY